MTKTAGTTTVEVPLPLRARLAALKRHPRQPYHEVVAEALDLLDGRRREPHLDPLVARHRQRLRAAARRNRIARIWLVGSRARGDARPASDVDILCDPAPGASLFDTSAFHAEACEILGVQVNLLELRALKKGSEERILPEAVVL